MAEQQLVDYIQKAKQAGQTDDQTRALLSKNGWTEAEIADAFMAITSKSPPPTQPQQPYQQRQSFQAQPKVQPEPEIMQPAQQPEPEIQPQIQPQTQVKIQRPEPAYVEPQQAVQPQIQPVEQYQAKMPQMESAMPKSSHFLLKTFVALVVLALIGGGGYFALKQFNFLDTVVSLFKQTTVMVQTPVVSTKTENLNFAEYKMQSTPVTPNVPDYKLAIKDISNLSNFEKTQGTFSLAQGKSLLGDNFFIAKNNDAFYSTTEDANRNDDWTALYKKIGGSYNTWERQPENSVFISSDFVLHVYHKMIDQEFTFIEETNLYPTLTDLSKSMLAVSASSSAKETDKDQKASYERLSAYFLVTSSLLDNATESYNQFKVQNYINDTKADTKEAVLAKADELAKANSVSDSARDIAKQEITLIFDASKTASSPLMGQYQPGMQEDYTQYGPRSHYSKNVILRDYFRAMMFYGRMNFLLKSPELTRDALNITLLMSADNTKKWESIYQPTAFYVGQSDDLSIYDYQKAGKTVKSFSADKITSSLTGLQNELLTYSNPQIMSSVIISPDVLSTTKEDLQNTTKGFRFMGQRFTADAFIFSSLTQGDETADAKTGQKLPSTPTALMVSTLMGSDESSNLLDEWIKANAPSSDKVIANKMQTLEDYFGKLTTAQWTQNIYWSWLYTIKSLFASTLNLEGYPMFVKSENWAKKDLQSFLGSWTELKHDTLLYSKQSYAEMGAGGPEAQEPKPVPKGYVEPNVDFFDKLIALATFTNDGFKKFGVLPSYFDARNETFLTSLNLYKKIAVAELQNETISDEDFEKLRLDAGNLDGILASPDSQVQLESNARSAVIADVHTDVKTQKILYEADGIPNYIYVAVQDANGTRLTKGLVYSYYEFTAPLAKRLTDQYWQGVNYSTKRSNLVMPWWNKDLVK